MHHLRILCAAAALSGLAIAPAFATARESTAPDNARVKIEAYLKANDVAAAADLRALAQAPTPILMAIANDEAVDALFRSRAVAALRLLPSPSVQGFLTKLVQAKAKATTPGDRLIVRRAAIALGWTAAPSAPATLAQLLENDDPQVRLDAVIGLGLTRTEDAAVFLSKRLPVEEDARVRDQIEKQLRALAPVVDPAPSKGAPRPSAQPMRSGF